MTTLLQLDWEIFQWVNTVSQNPFFDWLLPIWRNKLTWVPLYLGLAGWMWFRFKTMGLWLLLVVGLAVGVSDVVSSRVVKANVERIRPCNDPNFKSDVRLLVGCGSGFSFTSSHAANHFCLAVLLILTVGRVVQALKWPLLIWAFLVAYAQVYVGVHFPFDVIGGGILGSLIGWTGASFFNSKFNLTPQT